MVLTPPPTRATRPSSAHEEACLQCAKRHERLRIRYAPAGLFASRLYWSRTKRQELAVAGAPIRGPAVPCLATIPRAHYIAAVVDRLAHCIARERVGSPSGRARSSFAHPIRWLFTSSRNTRAALASSGRTSSSRLAR